MGAQTSRQAQATYLNHGPRRTDTERAAITSEMDRLNAGGDYGRAAAELYQRLENRRDIIDANLNTTRSVSLSGTGYQEPGDLLGYLQALAAQAPGAPPDAFERMLPEEQRQYIKDNAPDYFIARTDKTARIYGEAAGGLIGRALGELGIGMLGVAGGAAGIARARGPGVGRVGGRWPINSGYAGQVYPIQNLSPGLQRKYPNSVAFTPQGYPDFSPYAVARAQPGNLTGNYSKDAALANKEVGLSRTPDGYTWHHVEDGRTLLLVPRDLHRALGHTGGVANIKSGGVGQ